MKLKLKRKTKKTRRKKTRKVTPPRKVTCSTCGGEAHNARGCTKEPVRGRHVMIYEAQANGTFWAPYGEKGWSAVRIRNLGYKHARVDRVKPKTQEVVTTKGKVRLDELIGRDPKLVGADRPRQTPDELFADFRKSREALEAEEKEKKVMDQAKVEHEPEAVAEKPQPKTQPKLNSEEEKEHAERMANIFDMLEDGSTDDDW